MPESIRLGPFVLEAPLGRGGMGEVWRGRHGREDVPVAVKVLAEERARDAPFQARFRDEVEAVARLDHPNVVLILDHGLVSPDAERASHGRVVTGAPWLAMELATGGSLASLDRTPPWRSLREILLDVLEGLAHAHAHGLVHRDLKPANILRAGAGDLRPGHKISDFGLAHALDRRSSREAARAGTPRYMAPEQFEGRWRDYGPWTDLYALGATAWELASGRAPFEAATPRALASAHASEEPPPLSAHSAVPAGFEGWLRKLLEKEPAHRFVRAADAAFALAALGPAVETRGSAGPVRKEAETTVETSNLAWAESSAAAIEPEPSQRASPPPIPESWRSTRIVPSRKDGRLVGAGLGLFALRSPPLQGREAERDALWRALLEVHRTGEPRLVCLVGAAGNGKSRLAAWLCERAHEVGAATVLCATHGWPPGPGDGLGPMLAAHVGAFGLTADEVLDRVRRSGARAEESLALAEVAAPAGRVRFERPAQRHAVVLRYLERLAGERPVLVWLDDVAWSADALAFAVHVLEAERPSRVLLVLTARSETLAERPVESSELSSLAAAPRTRSLEIGPLPAKDHGVLVEDLLGLEPILAARVADRTAGSPLFAVQLVGDWVARDLLEVGPSGFRLRGDHAELPEAVGTVWSARVERVLDGLGEQARLALEIAAVAGRTVEASEWRQACARARVEPPSGLLERLFAASLARPTRPGSDDWELAHGMLREAIEESARVAGRLADHHAVWAMVLEDRDPGDSGALERRGRHLVAAGSGQDAIAPLLASARARCLSEPRRTLDLVALAEGAMRAQPVRDEDIRHGECLLLRADGEYELGNMEQAASLAQRAGEAAASHGWHALLPRALLRTAVAVRQQGRLDHAAELALRALAEFEATQDVGGAVDALVALGHVERHRRRTDAAMDRFRDAARRSLESGDDVGAAWAWQAIAALLQMAGDYEGTEEFAARALRPFERHGIVSGQVLCLNSLAEAARYRGRWSEAEDRYRSGLRFSELHGIGEALLLRQNLGFLLLTMRRFDEAGATLEACRRGFDRVGRKPFLACSLGGLAACAAATGDWDEWERRFAASRSLVGETGLVEEDVAWPAELCGDLAREAGRHEAARAAWSFAVEQWRKLGRSDRVVALQARLA